VKKVILISIIAVLIALSYLGVKKARKMLALKKAKVNVDSFQLLDKINFQTLNTGLNAQIALKLQNYSQNEYQLEQLQIDLYAPSGKTLATQQEPIKPQDIAESTNTYVNVKHYIKSDDFLNLLQENNFITNDLKAYEVALKLVAMDLTGLKLIAKGFAVIDGLEIEINQEITL
jgi:hypothetical protein